MKRSSSEIRRAIQFERKEADECRNLRLAGPELHHGQHLLKLHEALADALKWAHGDPGTAYERLMKERNRDDVARMPAKGGQA